MNVCVCVCVHVHLCMHTLCDWLCLINHFIEAGNNSSATFMVSGPFVLSSIHCSHIMSK